MNFIYNYSKSFYLLAIVLPLINSCANYGNKINKSNYTENINQQFWSADWSSNNKFIAVGGVDSVLRIYFSNNLKLYSSFRLNSWIHSVKWNNDSKVLAVATLDKDVQLINTETRLITRLQVNGGARAIGWNFDGTLLATGGLDGVIKVWTKQGALVSSDKKKYGDDVVGASYTGLDWHPGKNIFAAINFGIHFFDDKAQEIKLMEHTNKAALMLCVNWHPSGIFFVIGDYGHNWEGENVPSLLHFWNENGQYIKSIAGSKREYRNISWNAAGTKLATASDVLRIWSADGNLLHEGIADSTNNLWGIDWSPASDKIVTASRFKTIAIWDSSTQLLKRIDVGSNIRKLN